MQASDTLWEFHKEFEGYSPKAYRDSVGVLTIGVGHANQDIEPFTENEEWDNDKIYEVWQRDISRAEELANGWLRREVPQAFFDVAVDIIYNTGRKPATYIACLNAGDLKSAQGEILRWVYAGGRVLLGLVRRRFAGLAMTYGDNWYELAQIPVSSSNLTEFNDAIRKYCYEVERTPDGLEILRL